jgi:short-subunit dehydrogenase
MQAVLPTMLNQGYVCICSGGRIAFPFDSASYATKFALEGLSESLHYEVEQFGIKIILIEPDVVKYVFFENLKMATNAQRSYSPYLDDTKNKCSS